MSDAETATLMQQIHIAATAARKKSAAAKVVAKLAEVEKSLANVVSSTGARPVSPRLLA
jgi:hypothetical protein